MGSEPLGREVELRAIGSAIEAAAGGQPAVLALTGPAGIGKTALLDEALRRAESTGALVLRGTCQEDAAAPFGPIAIAVRTIFRSDDPLASVTGWVGERDPESGDGLSVGSRERALRVILGVTDRILDVAGERLVVLALDDANWADTSSAELLLHLLERIVHGTAPPERGPLHLALLLAARPPARGTAGGRLIDRLKRFDSVEWLSVDGLDQVHVDQLVKRLTGRRPSRPLLRNLVAGSAGNPLLVRSMLDRLEAFGGLGRRGNELTMKSSAEVQSGPRDLDRLLGDRLRRLSPGCIQLLTTAAFLGDMGSETELVAISGLDLDRAGRLLDEANQAAVLDVDGDRFRFEHPQYRQILYHGPRGRRRAELHRRIAEHLDASNPDPDDGTIVAIASHLRRAGGVDNPTNVAWQAEAGQAAERLGAWAEAADAYDAALASLPAEEHPSAYRCLLLTRAARAQLWAHDNDRARALGAEAIDTARGIGAMELWGLALHLWTRGVLSSPTAGLGPVPDLSPHMEYLSAVERSDARLAGLAHTLLARVACAWQDLELARHHVDAAIALSPPDDHETWSHLGQAAGVVELYTGTPERALRWFEVASGHADQTGEELYRVWISNYRALGYWTLGDLDAALRFAEDARQRSSPIGAWAEHALSLAYLCRIREARGELEIALDLAGHARAVAEWAGWRWPLALACASAATAAARLGRRDLVDQAIAALASSDPALARAVRPLALLLQGALAEAEAAAGPLLDDESEDAPLIARAALPLGIALARGTRHVRGRPVSSEERLIVELVRRGIRYDVVTGLDLARMAGKKRPTTLTGR